MAGARERTFHVLVYSLAPSSSVCQPSSVVAIVENMNVSRNRLLRMECDVVRLKMCKMLLCTVATTCIGSKLAYVG